jgi:outer membrane protein
MSNHPTTTHSSSHSHRRRRSTLLGIAAMAALASASIPLRPLAAQTAAAPAANAPARTITFDDAIDIALERSTAILQAKNAAALDATAVRQQRLAFLPDLRFSANTAQAYGRSAGQTGSSTLDGTARSLNAGLSASVTLFDGFQTQSSLHQAQLTQEAGTQDLARAKQTAAFTVASDFLSLITQQEQLRVQQENLTAQQALEQQIQKMVTAGTRPIADLYQQQAQVASAQAAIVDAQRAAEVAKLDLVQLLQLDPGDTYDFEPPPVPAASDSLGAAPAYDLDSLLTRAVAERADLNAAAARVSAADQEVKVAEGGKWPTISLTTGYSTSFSSTADPAFLQQLEQQRGGSIGIGISIPLFDRGSTDAATQRAKIEADNARLSLASARQQAAVDVRRAYLDYQAAQQQLAAAEAQQRAATLATTTSEQRYNAGAGTLVELSQARATQVQAASALVNARYNLVFQRALMSYYTGELDPQHITLG